MSQPQNTPDNSQNSEPQSHSLNALKKQFIVATLLLVGTQVLVFWVTQAIRNDISQRMDRVTESVVKEVQHREASLSQLQHEIESAAAALSRMQDDMIALNKTREQLAPQVAGLIGSLDELDARVSNLTTDEIESRMEKMEGQVRQVSSLLAVVKEHLTDETVEKLIRVKGMAEEIANRKKLEDLVGNSINENTARTNDVHARLGQIADVSNSQLANATGRISGLETDLRNLFYWILGGMGTVIGAVALAAGYIARQLGQCFSLVPRSTRNEALSEEKNQNDRRGKAESQ